MPSAEIITIGTELLLGEITDTNATYLARALRALGIDVYRKTTVGDNVQRIAQAIRQALERAQIVITTGGLGPTVDDPTRQAVAQAMGVDSEFHPELWQQIQRRFERMGRQASENNRRQAYIPRGALVIENPVGTAPSFVVESAEKAVIALPGVPREMEYLLHRAVIPYLRQRFGLNAIIKARLLHTAGAGESQIDELIGELETLDNPTVGLAAHAGRVDVRITAKAASEEDADALIAPIEADIRRRLGEWVFGADEDTLEHVALQNLARCGWSLAVVEAGLGGNLVRKLAPQAGPFLAGEILPALPSSSDLLTLTDAYRQWRRADVGLGVAVRPTPETLEVLFALISPRGVQQFSRPYGGPPASAPLWAVNQGLNLLRTL